MANMTWGEAIEEVLGSSPEPMHLRKIAEQILERGLLTTTGNPAAIVRTHLAHSIRDHGVESPFERVGRGVFRMRRGSPVPSPLTPVPDDEPRELVTAFGVYWERDAVDWKARPHLYGEFQTDGVSKSPMTRVDFAGQHGLYLLHDVREVVYVGRTTTGDLGKRLYDHTRDRLQGRWSRFSWFGFHPVSEDGELGDRVTRVPPDCGMDNLISAVEAILIEALEPRQNRKSGDGIAASEYRQIPDPAIEGKRLRDAIARLTGS